MSSQYSGVSLKAIKQKLTRNLNGLMGLMEEAEEYQTPWHFPTTLKDLQLFLVTKSIIIEELQEKLARHKETVSDLYQEHHDSLSYALMENKLSNGKEMLEEFDEYWKTKEGENIMEEADRRLRLLEKRMVELRCQDTSLKQEVGQQPMYATPSAHAPSNSNATGIDERNLETQTPQDNLGRTLERRLFGNELKIPEFHGEPSEFPLFWELFEELVDKQPYSNIEKFSILLNCCKGDAARTIQMIPRTGQSYERAVEQLKKQFMNPHRITREMIGKLKTMRPSNDDPKSLRNTLNDIQAIVATLKRQGEIVDTANMISLVTETFSLSVQNEIATKEFDSGNCWKMDELLDNLSIIIQRREFMEDRRETSKVDQLSTFHTRAKNMATWIPILDDSRKSSEDGTMSETI